MQELQIHWQDWHHRVTVKSSTGKDFRNFGRCTYIGSGHTKSEVLSVAEEQEIGIAADNKGQNKDSKYT